MIERVNKVDECVMTVEHASWCEQRCGTMRMAEQDGEDVPSEGGRRDVSTCQVDWYQLERDNGSQRRGTYI